MRESTTRRMKTVDTKTDPGLSWAREWVPATNEWGWMSAWHLTHIAKGALILLATPSVAILNMGNWKPSRLVLGLVAVLASILLVGVSSASAMPEWSGGTAIDQPFLAKSLSCPSSSFCVAAAEGVSPAIYNSGAWTFRPGSSEHVSCTSSSFCIGVAGNDASVFNGTTWSAPVQVTASTGLPRLDAVSCASESFCIAIDEHANAYKFNGATWTAAANVAGGEFEFQYAVSCVSETFCAATDYGATSVYNGTTWTQHNILSSGELDAITCLSESFCVAAGTAEVRFNGATWSVPAEIDGAENITGIACESVTTCVAVDRRGDALTSSGATWSAPTNVDPFKSRVDFSGYEEPRFTAASCTSAECRAVDNQGRVFTFSGGTWTGPAVLGGQLLSVSCPTGLFCAATDNTGRVLTFDGSSWTAPTQIDSAAQINGITCLSASFCVALDGSGNYTTYNGASWSVPSSSGLGGAGRAISCVSDTFCMGAGLNGVAKYNGSSWTAPTPVPADGVSCASESFCVSVGANEAAVFNGTTWSSPTQLVKNPTGPVEFESVSCPSTHLCVAVDYDGRAMTFNGSSWSEPTPVETSLESVSCPSTTFCEAASEGGVVVSYNGSSWTTQLQLMIGGVTHVSCASFEFCMAVMEGSAFIYGTPGSHGEEARKIEEEAAAKKRAEEEAAAHTGGDGEAIITATTSHVVTPAEPVPVLGQRQTVKPVSGTVLARLRGSSGFVPLSAVKSLPDGSEVDATSGRVIITVATSTGTVSAEAYGGRFVIEQEHTGSDETRFVLSLPLTGCPRVALPHGSAAAVASSKHRPKSRHLWVSEKGGSWGTNGRYVSTSVEGTHWLTLDECDKSEVKVVSGKVKVHDLVHNKIRTLTAGESYVATRR
jgi:hypothetical protein